MSRRPYANGGKDGRVTIQIAGVSPAFAEAFRNIAEEHGTNPSALGRKMIGRLLIKHGYDPETGQPQ